MVSTKKIGILHKNYIDRIIETHYNKPAGIALQARDTRLAISG